jgi:hypothetical protein
MSKLRAVLAAVLLAPLLAALPVERVAATPPAHPFLLFGAADVPALQAKIASGVPAQAWAALKRKVDAYVTPGPSYILTQQQIFFPSGSLFPDWRVYDGATAQNQIGSYLMDLSTAYMLSGDTRYSDMAIQVMLAEANSDFPAWYAMDGKSNELGMGDMSKGMAMAWDLTYDRWSAADKATYIAAVNRDAGNIFKCLSPSWAPIGQAGNNWYSVCGGGTGLLLLALEGEPGLTVNTATLLTNAKSRVLPYLQAGFGQGGDGQEGFNYASYGLHNAIPFALAWQRSRAEDLIAQAPGVANVPRWVSLEQIPGRGGRLINRNDSNETLPLWQEVLPMFFAIRPDGLTAWDWDHMFGAHGDDIFGPAAEPAFVAPVVAGDPICTSPVSDPTRVFGCWNSREAFTILYWQGIAPVDPSAFGPPSQSYPERGLVGFRTGWAGGQSEVAGTFEARHNGTPGIHTQQDAGHFTFLGYGGQWAVDSGYAGGQNNAGASGHNLVTISCAQNVRNGSFDNFNAMPTVASGPGQTLARADLRYSFSSTPANIPWAERAVLFTSAADEPPLLAVVDSVNATGTSVQYCWKMHTDSANAVTVINHNFILVAPSGAGVLGSTAGGGVKPNLVATPYAAGNAPAIHTVIEDDITTANYDHIAVLALQPQYQSSPLSNVAYPVAGGNAADITWPGGTITIAATNHGVASLDNGNLQLTGKLGKVRAGKGESVLESGSLLSAGGRTYISVTGGSATVVVGGDQVRVTSSGGLTCQVYAPQAINAVTVNGTAVTPTRVGDDLTFAC